MQLLIKHDKTYVIHPRTTENIPTQVATITGIPEHSLLLIANGKVLSSDNFDNLIDDCTIHATHRMIGGGPKKRCQAPECSAPALRGLDCSLCAGQFCGKHRLLEQHSCAGLANCKEELRRANQVKLEKERCVAPKVI